MASSRACSRPSCFSLAGFRAVSGSASSRATSSARASAWRSRASTLSARDFLRAVLLVEALDPAGGIEELLLPGVVRMAAGADFDVNGRRRGARLESVATGALYGRPTVVGMNSRLHKAHPSWLKRFGVRTRKYNCHSDLPASTYG